MMETVNLERIVRMDRDTMFNFLLKMDYTNDFSYKHKAAFPLNVCRTFVSNIRGKLRGRGDNGTS